MDETSTRRTLGTGIAVIAAIGASFMLGRCSTGSAAAPIPVPESPIEYVAHDAERYAAIELANAVAYIQSTTTTIAPRTGHESLSMSAAPAHDLTSAATENNGTDVFTPDEAAFFTCVRWRESRGDYGAVNPTGTFRGAYQWYQGGWDHYAAQVAPEWVGVEPNLAPPAVQDLVSVTAYRDLGARPWGGACS